VQGDDLVACPYRNDTLLKTCAPLPDAGGAQDDHVLNASSGRSTRL
jgi:hypothetical protein